jgi:Arc/MetJ-type ribon-helix-helix transcriptional regulator
VARRVPQLQVNVRLDEDLVRILEAAAFVQTSSVSEIVRTALEGIARQWGTVPAVRQALDAREKGAAELDDALAALTAVHSAKGESSGG